MMQSEAPDASIVLDNDLSEVTRLGAFLDELGGSWGLSHEVLFKAGLALDEVVTNIVRHSQAGPGDRIRVRVRLVDRELVMQVEDHGRAFDPLGAPVPDTNQSIRDRKIGGLGIHLVRSVMDRLSYRRSRGRNILTLVKKLEEEAPQESQGSS